MVFFNAVVSTSGNIPAMISGSAKFSASVFQSAARATTTARTARTPYWIQRDTCARLRGLMAMAASCRKGAGRSAEVRGHVQRREVLLEELLVGAVLVRLGEGLVDGVEEIRVLALGDAEAVLLAGVELHGHLGVRVLLGVPDQHCVVVDRGVDAAALDRLQQQGQVFEHLELDALGRVVVGVLLPGGADLDAQRLAL